MSSSGLRAGEVLFPKGLVSGVQLETVLRRLSKAEGFRKFNELPIPFRAVATDLVTGKAVVFSEGELPNVMRASMSVPGAIDPVEIGDMMLVDGGLTDNLPVNIARTMGADIVIAVNLGTPLMKRDDLTSIFGVTGQMINILTEQNVQVSLASLKPTDILISPELGGFSAGDFDHLPQDGADRRGGSAQSRRSPVAAQPARRADTRRFASVSWPSRRPICGRSTRSGFPGSTRVNPDYARAEMETQTGQPLDQQTLDRDMRRLYGTDDFEHVDYRIVEEAGRRILEVDAVEKSWGPNYLRFGLGLSSDFQGDCVLQPARELPAHLAQPARRASGGSTCRSGAPPAHTPSSTSRSTRGSTSSSRPTPSSDRRSYDLSTTTSGWRSTTCATTAWASTSAASSRATARCASGC